MSRALEVWIEKRGEVEDVRGLRELVRAEYVRGWNEAIGTSLEAMKRHRTDWLGEGPFRLDGCEECCRSVEVLRRPEGLRMSKDEMSLEEAEAYLSDIARETDEMSEMSDNEKYEVRMIAARFMYGTAPAVVSGHVGMATAAKESVKAAKALMREFRVQGLLPEPEED